MPCLIPLFVFISMYTYIINMYERNVVCYIRTIHITDSCSGIGSAKFNRMKRLKIECLLEIDDFRTIYEIHTGTTILNLNILHQTSIS